MKSSKSLIDGSRVRIKTPGSRNLLCRGLDRTPCKKMSGALPLVHKTIVGSTAKSFIEHLYAKIGKDV